MKTLSPVQLRELAKSFVRASDEEREIAALALAGDQMLARRALDWLPEAFGLLMAGHVPGLELPTTFSARNNMGDWKQFPFSAEPLFAHALRLAVEARESGEEELFRAIADKSSVVATLNKALNGGASLSGAKLSGPALIGVPAETYAGHVFQGSGPESAGA